MASRQILVYSAAEKPRQALVGEILALEIAENVFETASFTEALEKLKGEDFSVALMDELTVEQRKSIAEIHRDIPVFYLSSLPLDSEEAVVYQKPFRLPVLLSAVISAASQYEQSDKASVNIGLWRFNAVSKTLTFENREIRLTDKESAVLNYLYRHPDPVDKETLLREIWGYADGISTHTLETHVYRLRQKLEETGISFSAGNIEGYKLIY